MYNAIIKFKNGTEITVTKFNSIKVSSRSAIFEISDKEILTKDIIGFNGTYNFISESTSYRIDGEQILFINIYKTR